MSKELLKTMLGAALCLCPAFAFAVDNPFTRMGLVYDCGAMKYNGEYYLTGNFLCGDMLSSRDLVNWGNRKKIITHVGGWATDSPYDDCAIHASEINYVNGVFHLYFQVDADIGHAVANNPWGMFTEPAPQTNFSGRIDAEYFRDDNGSNYFYTVKFNKGNIIFGQNMSDPWTLSGNAVPLITALPGTWENPNGDNINEGPFVFKHRGGYYMLYNANNTSTTNYQIGCVEAATPLGFSNSGKYPAPVLARTSVGAGEINTIGQPWVVDGPNGFEKWIGYFAIYTPDGNGKYQYADRLHFFDKRLFADGPTSRLTAGYHPDPAKPTLLNLFTQPDGPLPPEDWSPVGPGTWDVLNNEARQTDQNTWSLNPVNRDPAINYLIEANVKFNDAADSEDKLGVLAYYRDSSNWMIVGIDRKAGNWYAHRQEAGVNTIVAAGLWPGWNHSAYHKIRVERNGTRFDARIDDMVPRGTGKTPINTTFTTPGRPGIYTDHTSASFDGIIYTIGWDEFDAGVRGWGAALGDISASGAWTTATNGITQTNATGVNRCFKGDLMAQYEFAAQVYQVGAAPNNGQPHSMGIMPVVIDSGNYLAAEINLTNNTIFIHGMTNGAPLPPQSAPVAASNNYNLRAVKLPDRVILFVDGREKLTVNAAFGPSQTGLINQNIAARYNGILAYRTEPPSLPQPWQSRDIGVVGFAGGADINNGTAVVNGGGEGVFNGHDGCHFAFQAVAGDCLVIARLDSIDPTDYWAQAGLMFRESAAMNSRMVFLSINAAAAGAGDQHKFASRTETGTEITAAIHSNPTNAPILPSQGWLKLVRLDNTFSGYYSTNGSNWNLVGSSVVNMSANALAGLACSARNNSRVCGAVFDNVAVVPIDKAIYNRLAPAMRDGRVTFSYQGNPRGKYALERAFDLRAPLWEPILTNSAGTNGRVFLTNTPSADTNNFWRMRQAP